MMGKYILGENKTSFKHHFVKIVLVHNLAEIEEEKRNNMQRTLLKVTITRNVQWHFFLFLSQHIS